MGLSVEANELADYEREGAVLHRVLGLLRDAAGDPITLRVGGKSADDAYWETPTTGAPSWVFEIGTDWLAQLAALAHRDQLSVALDLNLAVHSPAMAASLAKAALAALGRSRLAGLAIGNEPDLFSDQPALERERVATTTSSARRGWTQEYTPARYRDDYLAYARALSVAAPGVALEGPEAARANPAWLRAMTGLGRLGPRTITVHRYPLSYCWPSGSYFYPGVASLLAERSSHGLAGRLRGAIAIAHRSGQRLSVSEVNSVSCAGNAGVSDSFASALWAPDALFELIRAGVDAVNWHMRPQLLNAPFLLERGSVQPLPELYGLSLFSHMIGANARRLFLHVSSGRGLHLKVWAVRSASGTDVLLINKGPSRAVVSVSASRPPMGAAELERLWAPSALSTSGVTLAGRSIGTDGRWRGHLRHATVPPTTHGYRVSVPGFSAALLTAAGL
ncbi:MAG: glycosyl hydrolase family 79 C-terminal domain-containing protein [Solirubrobacteraceae bacterium]